MRHNRTPDWINRRLSNGTDPDPRFSLANERTFLAWIRTALGLIALGVAVATFVSTQETKGVSLLLAACGGSSTSTESSAAPASPAASTTLASAPSHPLDVSGKIAQLSVLQKEPTKNAEAIRALKKELDAANWGG